MKKGKEREKKNRYEGVEMIKSNDSTRHRRKDLEANQVFQLRTLHKRIARNAK
jgi:hypothetical protein